MIAGDLITRSLEKVGEKDLAPVYYTAAKALSAANEAQRVFCLLTLCLEKSAPLNLAAGTSFYHVQDTFSDFLVPLRVARTADGSRIRPSTLDDLNAISQSWQLSPGDPEKYAMAGFDFFMVYPRPAADGTSVTITYAHMPARMVVAGSAIEIPDEYHESLVDYAVYRMRLQEGGQEFLKVIPLYQRFMAAAAKEAEYVRTRRQKQDYDRLPFELAKWLAQQAKQAEADSGE